MRRMTGRPRRTFDFPDGPLAPTDCLRAVIHCVSWCGVRDLVILPCLFTFRERPPHARASALGSRSGSSRFGLPHRATTGTRTRPARCACNAFARIRRNTIRSAGAQRSYTWRSRPRMHIEYHGVRAFKSTLWTPLAEPTTLACMAESGCR